MVPHAAQAGYYCPAGSSTIIGNGTCDAGFYCPTRASSSQQSTCPLNFYCPAGSTTGAPWLCPSGAYCPSAGLSVGVPCSAGSWCGGGLSAPNGICNTGFALQMHLFALESLTLYLLMHVRAFCPAGSSAASGTLCPAGSSCANLTVTLWYRIFFSFTALDFTTSLTFHCSHVCAPAVWAITVRAVLRRFRWRVRWLAIVAEPDSVRLNLGALCSRT